jgi:hypothetical protein
MIEFIMNFKMLIQTSVWRTNLVRLSRSTGFVLEAVVFVG